MWRVCVWASVVSVPVIVPVGCFTVSSEHCYLQFQTVGILVWFGIVVIWTGIVSSLTLKRRAKIGNTETESERIFHDNTSNIQMYSSCSLYPYTLWSLALRVLCVVVCVSIRWYVGTLMSFHSNEPLLISHIILICIVGLYAFRWKFSLVLIWYSFALANHAKICQICWIVCSFSCWSKHKNNEEFN